MSEVSFVIVRPRAILRKRLEIPTLVQNFNAISTPAGATRSEQDFRGTAGNLLAIRNEERLSVRAYFPAL
jgi:hypothetical protein